MSQLENMNVRDIPGRLGEIMTNVIGSAFNCKAVPPEQAPTARAAAYAWISAAEVMCGMKVEDFIDMMMAETKAAIKDVKEKTIKEMEA
jgi:hypothetical protein